MAITQFESMARSDYLDGLCQFPLGCSWKFRVILKQDRSYLHFIQHRSANVAETAQLHNLVINGLH